MDALRTENVHSCLYNLTFERLSSQCKLCFPDVAVFLSGHMLLQATLIGQVCHTETFDWHTSGPVLPGPVTAW